MKLTILVLLMLTGSVAHAGGLPVQNVTKKICDNTEMSVASGKTKRAPASEENSIVPFVSVQRGLNIELGYSPEDSWVSLAIPNKVLESLKPVDGHKAIGAFVRYFDREIKKLLTTQKGFHLESIKQSDNGLYRPYFELRNESGLEFVAYNLSDAVVNGEQSSVFSFPISNKDTAQNVNSFIEAMSKFKLPTN